MTPGNPSSVTTADDGVTVEAAVWITMAWTQILYTTDAWVKISRRGSTANITAADITIRSSNLGVVVDDSENNIYDLVPYHDAGVRFSVEFKDNMYSYRDSCATTTCDFVQDWVADGTDYVSVLTDDNAVMGSEPHDALLIFASPSPSSAADLVPGVSPDYNLYRGPMNPRCYGLHRHPNRRRRLCLCWLSGHVTFGAPHHLFIL
ncbi:glycosyl hydrolase family 49-domain-containing protein [Xylaria sp. FL1042]|nr:glycosyl hydrolase family 49-domain-containing protein [Xylaria sp. FL1042]